MLMLVNGDEKRLESFMWRAHEPQLCFACSAICSATCKFVSVFVKVFCVLSKMFSKVQSCFKLC